MLEEPCTGPVFPLRWRGKCRPPGGPDSRILERYSYNQKILVAKSIMNRIRQNLARVLMALLITMGFATQVLAQANKGQKKSLLEEGGKSYFLSYFILGVLVALAMFVLCAEPGRRREVKSLEP